MKEQAEDYEPMLKESIGHFLALYNSGTSDFSAFESIFFRLIQARRDPPLEFIWFYSAVTYHSSKLAHDHNPSSKFVLLRDLFQLMVKSSNSSCGLKKVALLAPVIYVMHQMVCDLLKCRSSCRGEIEGLVDIILNYIFICHSDLEEGNDSDAYIVCFEDLIRVWTIDNSSRTCKYGLNLRVFFPLLSDDVLRGIDTQSGIKQLAAYALFETFLLALSVKFHLGLSRQKLSNDLKNYAFQIISGFQNFYFLDLLLKMMLEPSLPISPLLSSADSVILQKVLYDALILFNYSYLDPGRLIQLPDNLLRNIAVAWSLVADNGIQFAREIIDQDSAISYMKAFSTSPFPLQLIKWVLAQAGMDDNFHDQTLCTPIALIKWFFFLEDKGFRIFDHNILKFHAKASICKSRLHDKLPGEGFLEPEKETILCSEQGLKDGEIGARVNEVLCAGDNSLSSAVIGSNEAVVLDQRKRKGTMTVGDLPFKLLKYDSFGHASHKERFSALPDDDQSSARSDIENPFHTQSPLSRLNSIVLDEDMEVLG